MGNGLSHWPIESGPFSKARNGNATRHNKETDNMKRLHRMGALLLSAIAILAISTSAPAATLPDDVQAIVKRGELRVGVKSDVPGFSMQDLSGEYAGMEVDLA